MGHDKDPLVSFTLFGAEASRRGGRECSNMGFLEGILLKTKLKKSDIMMWTTAVGSSVQD